MSLSASTMPMATNSGPANSEHHPMLTSREGFPSTPQACTWPGKHPVHCRARPAQGVTMPLSASTMPAAPSSGPASSEHHPGTRPSGSPSTPQASTWPGTHTAPCQARPAQGAPMPLSASTMPTAPSSGPASSEHHPVSYLTGFRSTPQASTWPGPQAAPCQARPAQGVWMPLW